MFVTGGTSGHVMLLQIADNGHLACLKFAHQNGCEWNSQTCRAASGKGQLSCLQYAIENGCDWNRWTCYAAAQCVHLSCLQWARENACNWNAGTCLPPMGKGKWCPWNDTNPDTDIGGNGQLAAGCGGRATGVGVPLPDSSPDCDAGNLSERGCMGFSE